MAKYTQDKEELTQQKAKKFNLWLGMIGMFMMFAALSSGFIVYTAGGIDRGIKTILPEAFVYSTILIVVSSVTIQLAYNAARRTLFDKQKLLLAVTILLGVGFFFMQVYAWGVLTARGVVFVNSNASQSFIYVFTGMHLAHIIAGILVLVRALVGRIRNIPQVNNVFRMDLAALFWHFLGFLWIYIYVFLLLNQ
ncbi:cytochrome c oxidase subunit 3 [Parapedobacter koreensis]|uniref:Cytochrome c oxidase subunit 3 n=1 Tax=Parapedobacter koreensis TaxID=332977 RepID=A0A1H7S6W5_9SPHI|nr:cytochrome c oxidase subunit 3 [Parapedobacter koreensis]SEL68352.1 cytochrome c oxidase subunit 3 [Parapedobacter koreensis]